MSEMHRVVYVNDCYYLLPDGCSSAGELLQSIKEFPAVVRLRELKENNRIPSNNLDLGICIAPYFYSDYGFDEVEVTIDDPTDVFSAEAELLTQKEYNARLRETVLGFCPRCLRYKPLSNRVQSLNGHFEEIALNSVCFYRQESKPAPRVFRENMRALGGLWHHFEPTDRAADDALDSIKSMTYLKYDNAEWQEGEPKTLLVSFKPDYFVQILTQTLSEYSVSAEYFKPFCVKPRFMLITGSSTFRDQIAPENAEAFRKNCKKYGVAFAILDFNPAYESKISKSIERLTDSFYTHVIHKESGMMYLLLLDECGFLKELHFRSPLFEAAGASIRVYDQYVEKSCRISFDMQPE